MHKAGHFSMNLPGKYTIGGFLRVRTKYCWSCIYRVNRNFLASSWWVSWQFLWWEADIWTWGEEMNVSSSWLLWGHGREQMLPRRRWQGVCVCLYTRPLIISVQSSEPWSWLLSEFTLNTCQELRVQTYMPGLPAQRNHRALRSSFKCGYEMFTHCGQ